MAENTVKESDGTVTNVEETNRDPQSSESKPTDDALAALFTTSALRIGLAVVGFFLLVAALGQLSGLDLFRIGAEAINTNVGRWIVVAVVAIALIVAAVRLR